MRAHGESPCTQAGGGTEFPHFLILAIGKGCPPFPPFQHWEETTVMPGTPALGCQIKRYMSCTNKIVSLKFEASSIC